MSAIAPETNVGLLAQPALREAANGLGRTLLALVLALVAGAVLIVLAGENPVTAYGALVDGALGGVPAIARTLRLAAPLIITGLAVTVAFRAGFIYLGVEGSLYVGALAAAVSGIYLAPHLPGLLLLPAALAAAALGGGAWAAIPAWLRTRWRVDEIVSTLMLNYVAVLLVDQLVFAYLQDPAAGSNSDRALTVAVPSAARLPFLMQRYGLTVAIFFAVALVALFAWIYRARVWGYEADMTGYNRRFARHGGIDVMRIGFVSMAAGGALAGFAGATEILGSYGRYAGGFAGDLGFDCITVALMGRLSPVGTMLAALFLGALKNGGASMELAVNLPRDLVVVLQGLILLMVTAQGLFSLVWRGWRPRGRA